MKALQMWVVALALALSIEAAAASRPSTIATSIDGNLDFGATFRRQSNVSITNTGAEANAGFQYGADVLFKQASVRLDGTRLHAEVPFAWFVCVGICKEGFTPLSCGVNPRFTGLIEVEADLMVTPQYTLEARNVVARPRDVQGCTLMFHNFSADLTNAVNARAALIADQLKAGIAAVPMRAAVERAWGLMNREWALDDAHVVRVHPVGLAFTQPVGRGTAFTWNMVMRSEIDIVRTGTAPRTALPLPDATDLSAGPVGTRVDVAMQLSPARLGEIAGPAVIGELSARADMKVKSLALGASDGKLVVSVDDDTGHTFRITGSPEYVPVTAKNTRDALRLSGVDISLERGNLFEKIAFAFKRRAFAAALEGTEIPLEGALVQLRAQVEKGLNLHDGGVELTTSGLELAIKSIRLGASGDLEVEGRIDAMVAAHVGDLQVMGNR